MEQNQTKKALPILFLVMFLVMLGFGIIIPVLPFFAQSFGATSTQLGFLMAVYSVMQFLFAPVWGGISDRIGRKPVMLIGILGLALSFFAFSMAGQLWELFAIRIVAGILSSANMPTVTAYVADITTPENRGKGMGMIGAAVGLGFIFGPAVGGIASKSSYSLPFLIAGISSAVTFLFVLFVLKESHTPDKRGKSAAKQSRWSAFGGSLSVIYIMNFVVSVSMAGLETTFAYFGADKAGLDTVHLGYIFMIMGFAGALVQGGLIGRLIKKFGEGAVIQMGLVISAIGFGLILLTSSFWTAALYLSIFGIGNGFMRPSVTALISKRTTAGQGSASGLLSSFDSLGRIIGPVVGGALYAAGKGLPYISGVILSAVALALYYVFAGRDRSKATA
ncbi:tetracycline resistance MFS efflux pump [Tumebacillus flagellatus]|uniref:Major facilitator transporter n=1 Tax=Tumebacillus flagellatus TaxID=1157490 RepID=A0A074LL42_9BACL|nr:tetracycline resistance MFS efflux pump [Tumebacillus flagellatus]KEO81275.1 major facilitator transporter [Tumebacillus flagellatus]